MGCGDLHWLRDTFQGTGVTVTVRWQLIRGQGLSLSSHFTPTWSPGGQNFIHTLFIIRNSWGHNLLLQHNLFPPGCVVAFPLVVTLQPG